MNFSKDLEFLDVTVVIPFYNRSNYAQKLLASILEQTFKPKFIYFVDNGSVPDEVEMLKSLISEVSEKRIIIRYLKTQKTGNANYARNLGMNEAITQYVAFLDSDDWWESCHLENSINILKNSDKSAIYGGAIIHSLNSEVINYSGDIATVETPFHILFSNLGWSAQTSSYIVDKHKIGTIQWDEILKRHQDYDFFLNLEYQTSGWIFNPIPSSNLERNDAVTGRNFDIESMINFLKKWRQRFPDICLKKYLIDQMDLCIIANMNKKYFEYYQSIYLSLVSMSSDIMVSYPYRYLRQKIIFIIKKIGIFSLIKKVLGKS